MSVKNVMRNNRDKDQLKLSISRAYWKFLGSPWWKLCYKSKWLYIATRLEERLEELCKNIKKWIFLDLCQNPPYWLFCLLWLFLKDWLKLLRQRWLPLSESNKNSKNFSRIINWTVRRFVKVGRIKRVWFFYDNFRRDAPDYERSDVWIKTRTFFGIYSQI